MHNNKQFLVKMLLAEIYVQQNQLNYTLKVKFNPHTAYRASALSVFLTVFTSVEKLNIHPILSAQRGKGIVLRYH